MKRIIILFCSIVFVQFLQAQSVILDSARNEIYRINQVFNNGMYLAFNMDIGYRVDSLNITLETEQMSGNYVLNKNNLYYNMGGTEYIQTDSFSYTLYADSKIMIMAKNVAQPNSALFPLKAFIDSLVNGYVSHYNITIDTIHTDSSAYFKRINFIYDTAGVNNDIIPLRYSSFYVQYNDESYLPSKFGFSYKEDSYQFSNDSTVSGTIKLDKRVDMSFSGYKTFTNTDIFNDMQYIIYNRQRKIYEPAEKYKDYQFITAGFENEDEEAQYYREVPAIGN